MVDDTHKIDPTRKEPYSALDRIMFKLRELDLSPRAASIQATGKPDFIRDLARTRRKRAPDAQHLSRLAEILGTTVEWLMDGSDDTAAPAKVRSEVRAVPVADVSRGTTARDRQPKIPLLGSAMGGEFGNLNEHIELTELHLGEVLDWMAADPAIKDDPDAYALQVLGESMVPAFFPGITVKISPRTPVSIGDNVVVQLRGEGEDEDRVTMVLIKRLVKRTASYVELEQYNPRVTFQVPTSQLALDGRGKPRIHKVTSAHFR